VSGSRPALSACACPSSWVTASFDSFAILTVLLQWCVDSLPPDAQVLEIGAGIGTTAIGLALATAHNQNALRRIVASESEDEVLSMLRQNAEANGVADLPIVKWDASRGAASLDSLPVPARQLTHVIGSDLISNGRTKVVCSCMYMY
jgi:16S rRNA A1518/A1519 N6-dimethyltransferase RsmA/KsgA/DIM1 with predicted DNA glycosylase/AP lyase activity